MIQRIFAVAVAATLLLAVGCGKKDQEQQGADGDKPAAPPTLTVGYVGNDHQLALHVAALEGERFKRDYGISLRELKDRELYELIEAGQMIARVRLVKVSGASEAPAAMQSGDVQIALCEAAAVAAFADKGQPFRIIAPLQVDGDMLVMKGSSPLDSWTSFVAAARRSDKPVRIGYEGQLAVAKLIFVSALKAEGIPWSHDPGDRNAKVILVDMMSAAGAIPMLAREAVDGFVMGQPTVAKAVQTVVSGENLAKIVCDLRDLPPGVKWRDHPCCCVAATDQILSEQPKAVKALLKVILLSTQLINSDRALAVRCASRWTHNPERVELGSIPTIGYLAEPTPEWLKNMENLVRAMQDAKTLGGRYSRMGPGEAVEDLCDMKLVTEAAKELRHKGLLK